MKQFFTAFMLLCTILFLRSTLPEDEVTTENIRWAEGRAPLTASLALLACTQETVDFGVFKVAKLRFLGGDEITLVAIPFIGKWEKLDARRA